MHSTSQEVSSFFKKLYGSSMVRNVRKGSENGA